MEVQTPATVYVASSEQLEGLILKAVRTIIPELAGYKKPAEEASDTRKGRSNQRCTSLFCSDTKLYLQSNISYIAVYSFI